jgi:hypothetical protein
MKLKTYSGTVVISTQQHAKSFGKRLYLHLSRNNTVPVTPLYVKTILEEAIADSKEGPLEGNLDEAIDELFNCKNARTMVMQKAYFEGDFHDTTYNIFSPHHSIYVLAFLDLTCISVLCRRCMQLSQEDPQEPQHVPLGLRAAAQHPEANPGRAILAAVCGTQ